MKNVLEIVSLDGFLWIEKFKEFLDELWRNIDLEGAHFDAFIDHQLQEKLVDPLKMWPRWIHILLCLNAGLGETKAAFFHVRKRTENVLLDHLNYFVQIRDDQADNVFLVLQELLQLVDGLESVSLHGNINWMR
jgi:hypothetical protein